MPKRRRRIVVPMIRWGCTVVAAVFVLLWAVSGWGILGLSGFTDLYLPVCTTELEIIHGMLYFDHYPGEIYEWKTTWRGTSPAPDFMSYWNLNALGYKGRWWFGIPLWAPALLFAIPAAALWTTHIRATRRSRSHACPKCGYDLRGLHGPNATCPECGPRVAPVQP